MKFNFGEKLEAFRDKGLSAAAEPNESRKNLTIKIIVAIIAVFAIANAILLGFVNSKAKELSQDKEAMAESLSKIYASLDKSPANVIAQSAFMVRSMLPGYTSMILKQVNDIVNKRDTMVSSLQDVAQAVHYPALNLSDTNDMNVIQSRLRGLAGHSKKLFDTNENLSAFVLKIASLTDKLEMDQNEFAKKLKTSPEEVYLPILEGIEKDKKTVKSLQQEVVVKTNTIAELKKMIEGVGTNKNELQQIIQQKQNELIKIKNEYSSLKSQIKGVDGQPIIEKSLAAAEVISVKKTSYPELYYKLKGEVMEYNSKWGFIIINFGSDSKVGVNIKGEEKEVNVPAPLDKEVYIARGDKFVAKARIINVYSKYSVANIIFPVAEEIKKRDSVFFDQPKSN